ncbi:MAG: hypothetical protein MUE85_08465 [Microscillaceae bacterium]|jgi:hypothetical protein|nr:hypothetical protein [Microscillaceae bacterium]
MKKLHFQLLKLGIWLSITFFGLTACQKDSDKTPAPTDPQPNPITKLLKKVDLGGGDYQSLVYNTHKQLIEFKDINSSLGDFITEFEYVNTTESRLQKAIVDGIAEYAYEYQNGKLLKIKQLFGDQVVNEYRYQYDGNGRLVQILAEAGEGSAEGNTRQVLHYNAQGNLNEVLLSAWNVQTQQFELISTTYYQDFDDKKNVEGWKLTFPTLMHLQLQKNNPRKVVIKDAQGELIAEATHTFEYDAQGYPTKVKVKSEQGEGPTHFEYSLIYY